MSRRVDDIIIVIGADTSTYEKGMQRVNKELSALRLEMAKASSVIITQKNGMEVLSKQHETLTKQIDAQRQKVDIARQAYEKISAATDATASDIKDVERAFTSATNELSKFEHQLEQNNLQQYTVQLTGLTNQLKQQEIATGELTDENAKYGVTQERLQGIASNLNAMMRTQANAIEVIRAELTRATDVYGENSTEVTNLVKRLSDAENAHEALAKQIKKTETSIEVSSTAFGRAANSIGGVRAQLVDAGVDMDGLERKAAALSLAIIGIGVAAAKAFLDFSKESVKVKTLLDESVISYAAAQKQIIALSNATGVAAEDMAEAMYDALSSGVDTANVVDFMGTAAKTAVAGFTDAATAVDVLTTALNSYGIETSKAEDIANKLLITQDKGKITVGELSQGLGNLVGVSANANVSLEETLSAIAALTANGLKGSTAISSMTQVLSNVIKPTAQAKEEAARLGLQFSAQALAAKGLSGFLEDVERKTHGNVESMGLLFGSTTALNDMLILTGSGAATFNETLDAMSNSAGQLNNAFETVTEDTGTQFFNSMNELKNASIQLGDALTPLIEAFTAFISVISSIPAPVLVFLGTLLLIITALTTLASTIGTLKTGIEGVSTASKAIGGIMGGLSPQAMKIVGIVMAIVAALSILLFLILAIKEGADKAGNSMANGFSAAGNSISKAQSTVSQAGKTPAFAHGTLSAPGGLALVGEQGPELVNLPRGSAVSTAQETQEALGGNTYIIENVTIDASKIKDLDDLATMFQHAQQDARAKGRR